MKVYWHQSGALIAVFNTNSGAGGLLQWANFSEGASWDVGFAGIFNSGPHTILVINSFCNPWAGSTPKVSFDIVPEHLLLLTQFFKLVSTKFFVKSFFSPVYF